MQRVPLKTFFKNSIYFIVLLKNIFFFAIIRTSKHIKERTVMQEILNKEIFAGDLGPSVEIRTAQLENSAGILGAAALLM